MLQFWPLWVPSVGCCVLSPHVVCPSPFFFFLSTFLLSDSTRCLRLILYISHPSPITSHFSKELVGALKKYFRVDELRTWHRIKLEISSLSRKSLQCDSVRTRHKWGFWSQELKGSRYCSRGTDHPGCCGREELEKCKVAKQKKHKANTKFWAGNKGVWTWIMGRVSHCRHKPFSGMRVNETIGLITHYILSPR